MGKAARRRTAGRLATATGTATGTDAVGSRTAGPAGWGGSTRRSGTRPGRARTITAVPFVARPFQGLAGETDWVAMREIVSAATARVRLAGQASGAAAAQAVDVHSNLTHATVATVLPMAAAGLRRADGEVLVGLQSAGSSGDASRDVAASLVAARDLRPGAALTIAPAVTQDSPRLQDLLDISAPFEVELHDGYDFWVGATGVPDELGGVAGLERANSTVVPTTRLASVTSAYWCRIGERAHLRWVLPHDEDAATDALARLHAAGASSLGASTLGATSRLLGAFRACGLLVPVWDLDPGRRAEDYERPVADLAARLGEALASGAALSGEERRARAGLLTRQITLR